MRTAGQLPKRRVPPQPEQPEWLQTPERIAVSEALKAHARYCAKACLPTGTARDPYRWTVRDNSVLRPCRVFHRASRAKP